jgi:hypothetical protein
VFRLYVLLLFSLTVNAQSVIQTFTDRCTGEVKTISIESTGYTTVFFYNQSRQFTAEDARNGVLRAWMEEVYLWWENISPCSSNQAASTAAQNTSTQATSNASSAASNATGGTQTSSSEQSNTQTENNTSNSSENENNNSTETENTTEEAETSSEESETTSEETTEDKEEETVEEEQQEEEKEEEKEEQEEEKEEEQEEKQKEKKQKKRNPINVSANFLTQSALDGTITNAASIGFSQSSLTGTTTYAANTMIWDNLNQFSLGISQSNVFFNYDKEQKLYLRNPNTGKKDLYFGSTYGRGSIMMVQSISLSFMYIYKTKVASFGLSNVYLGQKDNFLKGSVGGYAISGGITNIDKQFIVSPSVVFFGTKPFNLKRFIVSPMLAAAFNPVSYSTVDNKLTLNKYFTYIVGSNFDFNISKRFRANIGGNVVSNTNKNIPATWSITIGSKFKF